MFWFVLIFFVIIFFMQHLSARRSLMGISYDYTTSKRVVEVFEPLALISYLTNDSKRFISFIRLEETLPKDVFAISEDIKLREDLSGVKRFDSSTYLTAKSRLERYVDIGFEKRGAYLFQGSKLFGGDLLGLKTYELRCPKFHEVVVYPKVIHQEKVRYVLGGFLGEVSVRRFDMEDPVLSIGSREYTGREPFNRISWSQTAVRGKLMVRQMDYTVDPTVSVIMDLSALVHDEQTKDHLEGTFSITRTVCEDLKQKNVPFVFFTNAHQQYRVWSNQKKNKFTYTSDLNEIFELLGRSTYFTTDSFEELVKKALRHRKNIPGVILITPELTTSKEETIFTEINRRKLSLQTFVAGDVVWN